MKQAAAKASASQPEGTITVYTGAKELTEACCKAFLRAGVSKRDAAIVSASLVDASLRGIDTHGVVRLAKYVDGLKKGSINPSPKVRVRLSAPAVLRVDGDNGLGAVVASRTMDRLIVLAKRTGVAAAGVRSSNHYGTVSYYLRKAAEQNLIAMGCVHGESLQVPFGGVEPFFGTNPLAFVFPSPDGPVVIDFATSATTFGRMMQARTLKQRLPENQAIDSEGNTTTDPDRARRILPMAGHKGYGLALAVEVFSAILNGAPFGPGVPPVFRDGIDVPGQLGHFFVVIDPSRFAGGRTFLHNIGEMIHALRQSKPAPGFEGVMIPGEPESNEFAQRMKIGVPLSPEVWTTIQQLARG